MAYHHLAMAAADMTAIHHFYETLLEFELVKVEVGPVPNGGWAKHFFYRMAGDDSSFIAFWELHEYQAAPSWRRHYPKLQACRIKSITSPLTHQIWRAYIVAEMSGKALACLYSR